MSHPSVSVTRSLNRKLLLPLLVIGAVLAVVTVWALHAQVEQQLLDKLTRRAELLANSVNYAAETVSRPGDLQRIVTAFGAEKEVNLVVVVGGRPARVLATTHFAWLNQALTELPAAALAAELGEATRTRRSLTHIHPETDELGFVSPLLLSRPELSDRALADGAVLVHLDLRAAQAATWELTAELSLAFLAAYVVLALLGYGLIRRLVLSPIARIGALLERHGEDTSQTWAPAATDDEIGAFARTLHDCLIRTDAALRDLERQQNTLRDSEALYSSLVNNLSQCVFRKDREGRFTFANQHFCRLLGRAPAAIQGRTDLDLFPQALAEKYRRDDLRVMRERLIVEEVEENSLPTGERLYVQVVKTPLVNAAGEVVGVQGIFWDITERRRSEKERENLVAELQGALARVKTLSGLVPICSGCKKIRDDKNFWHQVESYIQDHTQAQFTHGLCPDCIKKYFPGIDKEVPRAS